MKIDRFSGLVLGVALAGAGLPSLVPTARANDDAPAAATADGSASGDGASDGQADKALARAREVEQAIVALAEKTSPAFVVIGGGSGIVVTEDGHLLTNHHVAGSKGVGESWSVKLPGRGILTARVVGHDPHGDISLLKLEGAGPFPHVELADSDEVKVGDFALALGNPFGFSKDSTPTVTAGLVSAVHHFKGSYSDAIQTDAPINPGNSGGPLLDARGRLIGINGQIAMRFGLKVNTGVGYAIPTNQIKRFLDGFRKNGIVHHGFVGGLSRVGDTKSGAGGAVVGTVARSSDAEKAGLKKGDVIVEADGRPVTHAARFHGIIGTIPAGEEITLKVERDGETLEVKVKLGRRSGDAASGDAPERTKGGYLGIRMSANDSGVVVDEVIEGSPASGAGLKEGDVVTHFGTHKVFNVNELVAHLASRKPGDKITLSIRRDGKKLEVEVVLGKRKEPEKD